MKRFLLFLTAAVMAAGLCAGAAAGASYEGTWYAVSLVNGGVELYPETWEEDLILELKADGRFHLEGRFFDNFDGQWGTAEGKVFLLSDNDDGTPATEEDMEEYAAWFEPDAAGSLLTWAVDDQVTIQFSRERPEKQLVPKHVTAESEAAFEGNWVLAYMNTDTGFFTRDQISDVLGANWDMAMIVDSGDVTIVLNLGDGKIITVDSPSQFRDGKLELTSPENEGISVAPVELTENGMLSVPVTFLINGYVAPMYLIRAE